MRAETSRRSFPSFARNPLLHKELQYQTIMIVTISKNFASTILPKEPRIFPQRAAIDAARTAVARAAIAFSTYHRATRITMKR
jgi:hypothetical protein